MNTFEIATQIITTYSMRSSNEPFSVILHTDLAPINSLTPSMLDAAPN